MFRIHLSKLLYENDMKQSDLKKKTGIRSGTVNAYYHEYVQRMNVKDLIKICDCLGCSLSELLEYNPKEK